MSELQEVIHRTSHKAFESGQITERHRIAGLIEAAKADSASYPTIPAYIILSDLLKKVRELGEK